MVQWRTALSGLSVVLLLTTWVVGCGGIQRVTLVPERSATILGPGSSERFGVCFDVTLQPPIPPSPESLWQDLAPEASARGAGLLGYQVLVHRGESCHRRTATAVQTALYFDLAAIPSAAIESAVLQLDLREAPTNFRGGDAQCSGLELGRALEVWPSGYHPDASAGNLTRPLIPYARDQGVGRAAGSLEIDVRQLITNWKAGTFPNHGMTFTVGEEHIMSVASTVERDLTDTTAPAGTRAFLCPWTLEGARLQVAAAAP